MTICPKKWLIKTKAECPPEDNSTDWFDGTTNPNLIGWFDRRFTDGIFRHWWNGVAWLTQKDGVEHWRQVGQYPSWRGMNPPDFFGSNATS